MALDLPHAHAARIHRHDLVVEAGKASLIALDQLRIERPLPIARNPDVELRAFRQNRLLRIAVAPVRSAFRRFALQMVVQLGVQNPLRQSLLQLIKKPILGKDGLRVPALQKLVQRVLLDRHIRPPPARLWPEHKIPDSPSPTFSRAPSSATKATPARPIGTPQERAASLRSSRTRRTKRTSRPSSHERSTKPAPASSRASDGSSASSGSRSDAKRPPGTSDRSSASPPAYA